LRYFPETIHIIAVCPVGEALGGFRPHAVREFTLEELSRLYWRMDKRGFQAMAREHPMFGFFVRCFEREDARAQYACKPSRAADARAAVKGG
jgi:hypothetical protein